jgi:hypothetical protein
MNMIKVKVVTIGFNKETPKPLLTPLSGEENRDVGDVVALITKGIVLIPLNLPPTTPTPSNLVFIARFMVMTSTVALHCILSFDKLNPRQVM